MKTNINEKVKEVYDDRWVNYPSSDKIIQELDQLIEFQISHRPENYLIISETNNGKTIIAKRFLSNHRPRLIIDEEDHEILVLDVLMIQCPYVADEKLLFFSILDQLNVPYKSSKSKQDLLTKVLDVLKRMRVKVLILDELQHLLSRTSKQRDMLNLLKYMSNEIGISFVGVGTKEAFYVINSDPQLANRFNRVVLPKWKYDKCFLSLLATYQNFMDLGSESKLLTPKISRQIYDMGEGLLGEYIKILKTLWLQLLMEDKQVIDLETIKNLNYISPSNRRDDNHLYA